MVPGQETVSNALFDVLSDWESILQAEKIDILKVVNEAELHNKKAAELNPQSELSKAFHTEPDKPDPPSKPSRKASRQQRGPSR